MSFHHINPSFFAEVMRSLHWLCTDYIFCLQPLSQIALTLVYGTFQAAAGNFALWQRRMASRHHFESFSRNHNTSKIPTHFRSNLSVVSGWATLDLIIYLFLNSQQVQPSLMNTALVAECFLAPV